nr:MAG TPA: hypothetical protein [Caudoviricetes sp.]
MVFIFFLFNYSVVNYYHHYQCNHRKKHNSC